MMSMSGIPSDELIERRRVSGISSRELFSREEGLTYRDFTILNTRFSTITKQDVSLAVDLGRGVILQTPIIGSPMDTVMNARSGIALALEGAIGVIHYNHKKPDRTPDVDAQINEIEQVKRYRSGFIHEPITVAPDMTIKQAIARGDRITSNGSPIENFPVTDNGESDGKLVGLLHKHDYLRGSRTDVSVSQRMLPREQVIAYSWPITLEKARDIIWEKHLLMLPIVDADDRLKYLVTRSDIEKQELYPLATMDEHQRLRVLFAVETWEKPGYERLERGFAAGADGVVIDTSQGFTIHELKMSEYICKNYPDKLLIGGNISTESAARFLVSHGVDAYRCGQGVGSICTTAGAIGIARPAAKSVYECARAVAGTQARTIADGGLREVGDIFKALVIGADCCMLGNLLAGTEESPGNVMIDPETGMQMKVYRGMGSKEANSGGIRGYSRLPEGVEGRVKYRGSIHEWVPRIRDGLLHAFEVMNYQTIRELHEGSLREDVRFELFTEGSRQESGVHSIYL